MFVFKGHTLGFQMLHVLFWFLLCSVWKNVNSLKPCVVSTKMYSFLSVFFNSCCFTPCTWKSHLLSLCNSLKGSFLSVLTFQPALTQFSWINKQVGVAGGARGVDLDCRFTCRENVQDYFHYHSDVCKEKKSSSECNYSDTVASISSISFWGEVFLFFPKHSTRGINLTLIPRTSCTVAISSQVLNFNLPNCFLTRLQWNSCWRANCLLIHQKLISPSTRQP